jgi:hypothetical protein
MTERLTLAQAALRLGLNYHQVRTMLFERRLRGGEEEGRYYVEAADVARLAREQEGQRPISQRGSVRARGGR